VIRLECFDVEAFHAMQVAEFGGLDGLRDAGGLESAPARPRNLVASAVFLEINGYELRASEEDVVLTFLALAAGEMSEARLAKWFAANTRKVSPAAPRR